MDTSDVCVGVSVPYPIGIAEPILTTQKQMQVAGLSRSPGNRLPLDNPIMDWVHPNKILERIDIQSTTEADIMKLAGLKKILPDDHFEYDIAIPLPPPTRSYKVTLNIKTIKKGKPTIVDPDWI